MSMLKDKLMKHLAKKGAKDLDPMDKEAKMGVIKELGRQAGSMMHSKVHPMMAAKVEADSPEGLKAGLDKAAGIADHVGNNVHEHDPEKIVEGDEEELHADLDKDSESNESSDHIAKVLQDHPEDQEMADIEEEHAEHSPDDLEAKIQKLQALKLKKQSGRA